MPSPRHTPRAEPADPQAVKRLAMLARTIDRVRWQGVRRDQPRLWREMRRLDQAARQDVVAPDKIDALQRRVHASETLVRERREACRELSFPPELPLSEHRQTIAAAIREHPVVVVSGDTGSGKTTQLPKICLELGLGSAGLIGCTQPRRIATLTVAQRVAQELDQPLGSLVGYQFRFDRKLSPQTRVKFMTDGILLAETRSDRDLLAYDTLIIDEAHERSLNIDFLLGFIKRTLPHRPDLKVIVSSATLDVQRFSAFFDKAPIIEVPGRLHPIELRYRPSDGEESDVPAAVGHAMDEIMAAGGPGDVLVFLTGERDIRETAEVLGGRRYADTEIIPLLASLPPHQQQRAFRTSSRRRMVLATNVAETSVTIPGIRYVVDAGLARISRFNHRTQVQRLHIEPISRASADQRKGRCGRIGPGICIRLYDAQDFAKRDGFTDPEIRRTSLGHVILSMLDLRLGQIDEFPFIEPPSRPMIREGYRELLELGAIAGDPSAEPSGAGEPQDEQRRPGPPGVPDRPHLTEIGRRLARFPIEPRLARMLLTAHEQQVMRDALIVVAALSTDDPRLRPLEQRDEADRLHARFTSPASDFAALLNLWRWIDREVESNSNAALRRLCRGNFISYRRLREWRDVHRQLTGIVSELKLGPNSAGGGDEGLHKALLSGLLSHIGLRHDEGGYQGARGLSFHLFPGSGLFKKRPKWVVAAELVDTSRLYARCVGTIDPEWIEPLAQHLCKYHYHSPAWDEESGFVRARETVLLYGLKLADGRRCDYSRIAPQECRDLFIRHALIQGEVLNPPAFLRHNLELIRELQEVEHKRRQRDLLLDEERLVRFFDERLPPQVNSLPALRRWLKRAKAPALQSLQLTRADLLKDQPDAEGFPNRMTIGPHRYELRYRHEHGAADDGITCVVPPGQMQALAAWHSDWLVPGALPEKLAFMIGGLPKRVQRELPSITAVVNRLLSSMPPHEGSLAEAVSQALLLQYGVSVSAVAWPETIMPDHLRMRFLQVDARGREIDSSRDLTALLEQQQDDHRADAPGAKPAADPWRHDGLTTWDAPDLPERVNVGETGWEVFNYPALVDQSTAVGIRLFPTPIQAASAHEAGLRRLYLLALGNEGKSLMKLPRLPKQAALYYGRLGGATDELGRDIGMATLQNVFIANQPLVRQAAALDARLHQCRASLFSQYHAIANLAASVLEVAAGCAAETESGLMPSESSTDVVVQLAFLVFPGFVAHTPWEHLEHYPRYLQAVHVRLERLRQSPGRDQQRTAQLTPYWQRYTDLLASEAPPPHDPAALATYRWMMEEWRVSLFAQELRTPYPISAKRLDRQWAKAMAGA